MCILILQIDLLSILSHILPQNFHKLHEQLTTPKPTHHHINSSTCNVTNNYVITKSSLCLYISLQHALRAWELNCKSIHDATFFKKQKLHSDNPVMSSLKQYYIL